MSTNEGPKSPITLEICDLQPLENRTDIRKERSPERGRWQCHEPGRQCRNPLAMVWTLRLVQKWTYPGYIMMTLQSALLL